MPFITKPGRYSKDPQVERTLRHSVRDGVAYSVMSGGAETYLSAFALFLQATAAQVALLATLPALIGSLFQLIAAWLGHRKLRRKPVILAGTTAQALVWLPMLLLPLWFPQHAMILLILCVTCYQATGNLVAPLWSSLMGDLVPERKRGRYFGVRTRFATSAAFLALAAGGATLHGFSAAGYTVGGFVVLFLVATLARLVSTYHIARMHEPAPVTTMPVVRTPVRGLQLLRESHALRFSLFMVCMQSAVAVAGPFFSVYMLRDLHFSYLEFMANIGAGVMMQFLMLNTWGRVSDVFGNRLILVATGSIIPVLPLLWVVSGNFWYLILVQLLSGFAWAGFSLSAGNFLYDLIPGPKRTTYMSFHNVVTAIGVFMGGMLGAVLTKVVPLQLQVAGGLYTLPSVLLVVFATSSLLRILVAVVFLRRVQEVRKVRKTLSPHQLVFRVARFNAFSGLLYDVVTMFRKGRE